MRYEKGTSVDKANILAITATALLSLFSKSFLLGIILLLASWPAAHSLFGQNRLDSLVEAVSKRDEGNFNESIALLERLLHSDPSDHEIARLYAQTLYWSGDTKAALTFYRSNAPQFPDDNEYQYEYALFLSDQTHYQPALDILHSLVAHYPQNTKYLHRLAEVYYWKGNWRHAKEWTRKTLAQNADHQEAKGMLTELMEITAPYMHALGSWSFDEQPMDSYHASLEWKKASSSLFNWNVRAQQIQRESDETTELFSWLEAGNRMDLPSTKTRIAALVGGWTAKRKSGISWRVSISQPVWNGIWLYADGAHTPYLYTVSSIDHEVSRTSLKTGIRRIKEDSWMFELFAEKSKYPDHNHLDVVAAWILAPAVRLGPIAAAVGYGYHAGNADHSRFASLLTADEIAMSPDPGQNIEGVYVPYFTPENTRSHSVLTALKIDLSKQLTIQIQSSHGFSGETDSPYLYLDNDGESFIIRHDFITENYNPSHIEIGIQWKASENWEIAGSYRSQKTIFYELQRFTIASTWKL